MNQISSDQSQPMKLLTSEQLAVGLKWFDRMSDETHWKLELSEQLLLLGGITDGQFLQLKETFSDDQIGDLHKDAIKRIGLLFEIHRYISSILDVEHAIAAFNRPNTNPIFESLSIKDYLLKNHSLSGFFAVRDYLLNAIHSPYL